MHLSIISLFLTLCISSALSGMESLTRPLATKENSSEPAAVAELKRQGLIAASARSETPLITELHQSGMVWIQKNATSIREGGEKLHEAISCLFKASSDEFFSVLSSANIFRIEKLISPLLSFLKTELGLQTSTLFLQAAAAGHHGALKVFLDAGVDINCTDDNGRTAVILATQGNHLETVKVLQERGACLDVQDAQKKTALHYAVAMKALTSKKSHSIASFLVERASPDVQDKKQKTPLMKLAKHAKTDEQLSVLRTCVQKSKKRNLKNKRGNTALHESLHGTTYFWRRNNEQARKNALCLIPYVDVNEPGYEGKTALMLAIGDDELVAAILKAGALVNAQDTDGNTALIMAANSFPAQKIDLDMLLAKGPNVHTANNKGETALMCAVGKNIQAAKKLIEKGAKTDIIDKNGKTLLMHAASGTELECVHLALKHGGKETIGKSDASGKTAIIHALESFWDNAPIIACLLDHGATIDLDEALILAAENKGREKVAFLLERGANINARDKKGATALIRLLTKNEMSHISGSHNESVISVAAFLLEKGIDVDAADDKGKTALMHALAIWGDTGTKIVELILTKKTEQTVNAQDNYKKTALMHASHSEANTKLLLAHGALPSITDQRGDNALAHAGTIEGARLLLDHTPTLDVTSAIRNAIQYNRDRELVEFLSSRGASMPLEEQFKLAILSGKREMAESTLRKAASAEQRAALITMRNAQGASLLIQIIEDIKEHSWRRPFTAQLDCFSFLIEAGVDVDALDNAGTTALIRATEINDDVGFEMAKMILSRKTDATVHAQNASQETALMQAARRGSEKIVELLLAHGARAAMTDKYGSTALDETSNAKITQMLLNADESLDVTNALSSALEYHRATELVSTLMARGHITDPLKVLRASIDIRWRAITLALLDKHKELAAPLFSEAFNRNDRGLTELLLDPKYGITEQKNEALADAKRETEVPQEKTFEKPKRCNCSWILWPFTRWMGKDKKD